MHIICSIFVRLLFSHNMIFSLKSFLLKRQLTARNISSQSHDHHLFGYTSGPFLWVLLEKNILDGIAADWCRFIRFNKIIRREERHVEFNAEILARAECNSFRRPVSDLPSVTKFTEGDFNRILQATFDYRYSVIARIPYNATVILLPVSCANAKWPNVFILPMINGSNKQMGKKDFTKLRHCKIASFVS